jgi:hypothetical protein
MEQTRNRAHPGPRLCDSGQRGQCGPDAANFFRGVAAPLVRLPFMLGLVARGLAARAALTASHVRWGAVTDGRSSAL